ncbi:Maf family protein [Gimesia algae]|uniref:dTTP/UTP pyrophosphatase n=1 Tax=Gimesia algae TaxID=2527971 RepID=A0A517VIC6_9PLAN|nr:Maf family protein [Gimesia algae]QDT92766.1 Maf-like protein YhdE [Gimesia algae]
MNLSRIILGSRSPRRKELLTQLLPETQIEVVPPADPEEAGFEQLHEWDAIQQQLISICTAKNEDVFQQRPADASVPILTADTIGVVKRETGDLVVLGQPPVESAWQETVKEWFLNDYAGRTHLVLTGVCLRYQQRVTIQIAETEVTFHDQEYVRERLDWYLSTQESRGKAGGYAIQGAGSIFVNRIEGSLSNVVGLPLETVFEMLNRSQTV